MVSIATDQLDSAGAASSPASECCMWKAGHVVFLAPGGEVLVGTKCSELALEHQPSSANQSGPALGVAAAVPLHAASLRSEEIRSSAIRSVDIRSACIPSAHGTDVAWKSPPAS